MYKLALVAVALLVFVPQQARAVCGGIPFDPKVIVFEPNQRALIAFNGQEEILLLSADLRVSEPTKRSPRFPHFLIWN
ncbi:MAG: hypothetical protein ACYC0X_19855 [Pirellulaceae bacterium]